MEVEVVVEVDVEGGRLDAAGCDGKGQGAK